MSKLLKKVILLTSRSYYHGGDGLERGELVFFRSQQEYDQQAKEKGWSDRNKPSFKSSWCVKPVEMQVLIEPKRYARFQAGENLLPKDVFFAGDDITLAHQIGGLY